MSLPARGRPPQAAARRVGLAFVVKLLTTELTSTDTTERNPNYRFTPDGLELARAALARAYQASARPAWLRPQGEQP